MAGCVCCRLTTEAEAVDRTSIGLPGVQSALTKAVVAANPNTVLIMLNAGPLAIEWEVRVMAPPHRRYSVLSPCHDMVLVLWALPVQAVHIPAIVEGFFPGELGGDVVAAVLLGDVAPAGRLPTTVYPADYISRNMTDYDLSSGNGTTHLYYIGQPLYKFGWGMSYSAFTFEMHTDDNQDATDGGGGESVQAQAPSRRPAHFSTAGIAAGVETIAYSVRVTNAGAMASAVSVVAMLSSEHVDAVRNEQLVDFDKTPVLQPGESTIVRLGVSKERLALIDALGDERIAAGEYQLRLGGAGSGAKRGDDFVQATFTLRSVARVHGYCA